MSNLPISLLTLQLFVLAVSSEKPDSTAADKFYAKFQQSDYNVTYEWSEVTKINSPEVRDFQLHIFKYNRTCPALNITMAFGIELGNEMELVTQTYKFASNEYRLFPLRMQVNFCKLIENNLLGAARLLNCGNFTGCPIRKGRTYHMCNWTPDQAHFPPFIPTGRYMSEYQGVYRNKELWVARSYGSITRSVVRK